jgi:hypothetical protein
MNAVTRKATAELALKGAQRVWTHLSQSDRADLADAARRIAGAADEVRRAFTQKGQARNSVELRLALAQLGTAVSAAVALMSETRRDGGNHARRHGQASAPAGSTADVRPIRLAEEAIDAEFNLSVGSSVSATE